MIVEGKKPNAGKIEINLKGSDGNAFAIMGYAQRIGNQVGLSKTEMDNIIKDMMSGDYENLLEVMENNFGKYIIMYR